MAKTDGNSSRNRRSQFGVADGSKFPFLTMEPNEGRKEPQTRRNLRSHPQNPTQQPYDYIKVHPFEIKYTDGQQKPYEPMRIPVATRFFEKFSIPNGMDPTVQVISELFLPDLFLARVAKCSNLYGRSKGHSFKPISAPDILVFFSIIFYMGVVQLPAKTDYWNSNGMWPTHKVLSRMSYKRFQVIWRNIYLVKPGQGDDDGDETDSNDEGEDTEDDDISESVDERWFAKAAPIIDLVNETSKKVCKFPAFCVSIDEQMKKFKGRSGQTFRMKNKPISEGYKFWAICCANSGFCYHYIPAARTGNVEGRKIIDSVLLLLGKLPQKESKQYVAAMDNLFTLSKVLSGAREMNVAICGTARARRGWPPKEYKNIFDERFNSLYWINDKDNFQIQRWVDNNVVTMVTTMHTPDETVSRIRKKPRVNAVNKVNLDRIWGENFARMIEIPKVIDDYNHWMGGVDRNDQLISNYRHQLRCKRIWMPLMLHSLDVLRVNAYLAHVGLQTDAKNRLEQKEFILSLVEIMQERAIVMEYRRLRSAHEHTNTPSPANKRQRINPSKPCLPIQRLQPPPG